MTLLLERAAAPDILVNWGTMRHFPLILPLLALLATNAEGQFNDSTESADRWAEAASFPSQPVRAEVLSVEVQVSPVERRALAGTLGWALGLAGGAALGYLIQPDPGDSYFGAGEWWLGAWVGSSMGAATGVHLANHRQGRILLSSLGAFVSLPVSLLVAVPLAEAGGIGILAIPVAQIGTSIVIERLTSRRGAR